MRRKLITIMVDPRDSDDAIGAWRQAALLLTSAIAATGALQWEKSAHGEKLPDFVERAHG